MNLDPSAFVADPELLAALEQLSASVACPTDRLLFSQGDPATGLYVLHSGKGQLTMTSASGDTLICTPVGPGTLMGLPGVLGNQPYSLTGIAFSGAGVSYISREDFAQLMMRDPSLSLCVLRILAAEVRTARVAISHT